MRKASIILIAIAGILFVTDWIACDLLYDKYIESYDSIFGSVLKSVPVLNPYLVQWHKTRNILESFEMLSVVSVLIVALKHFKPFLNWHYLICDDERDICVRVTTSFWQLVLSDFIDRAAFDENQLNWNDFVSYIWATYYLYKTWKIYVSARRKNNQLSSLS